MSGQSGDANVQAVSGSASAQTGPAIDVRIVPEASLSANELVGTVGQLSSSVQGRNVQHYYISQTELSMLEKAPEGSERTWSGVAVGGIVAFGLAHETLALTPYHAAVVNVGLGTSFLLSIYFGLKVLRARSLSREITASVRTRPQDPTLPVPPVTTSKFHWRKPWYWGSQ
jgi:hypothetical protein